MAEKQITGSFTISVGIPLHTKIYQYYLRNEDRYSSFSAMIGEAVQCLMINPNWRAGENDNRKLDEILELVKNMKVVGIDVGKENDRIVEAKFNASEGFVIE